MNANNALVPISVVIPVKNESANLQSCLSRLHRFAEIIVVDSSSTYATPRIALEHGVKLINFDWDGHYPKKRNWLLLHHSFMCDWVLFLDADELVDDAFVTAAHNKISQDQYSGYWLNYTNYFLGRPLRFGIPQRKLALFRVGKGHYERIEENKWSALDMEVHEHPIIDGGVGEIRERIEHRDFRGVLKFIDRHRDYAVWEFHRLRLLRTRSTSGDLLTQRQRFKYACMDKWWYPYLYFCIQYFARLGVLDGHAGLQYALYKFWYFSTIRLLCISSPPDDEETIPSGAPGRRNFGGV